MGREIKTYDDIKRRIYFWASPFIISALGIYNLISQQSTNMEVFYLLITRIFAGWCFVFLICMIKRRLFHICEYINLAFVSLFYIAIVMDCIFNYMVPGKDGAIGISIIWNPILFIYIFFTLQKRRGLIYSLFIFLVTLWIGVSQFGSISNDYKIACFIFLMANIVYIIAFYFAQNLFKVFADLEAVKKTAYSDVLTGIGNRRQLDLWLSEKVSAVRDTGASFSVLFFDVDYFKEVNDRYGHKAGDEILRKFTGLVTQNISESELFGRWGGEEFIIITNSSIRLATELAGNLKTQIHLHEFIENCNISASFGVTDISSKDTVETVLERVDDALYQSKKNGRNQVTVI